MSDTPKRTGNYKPGPGRAKGYSPTRYVTIASLVKAIQDALGISFQEAYADLMLEARENYLSNTDLKTYPAMMNNVLFKVVEQAKSQPEDTAAELESLSVEELQEKRKQAVIEYIKENGVPS